jgi:prepilin-type N-terminal cleavage/methylation domain-containing protein
MRKVLSRGFTLVELLIVIGLLGAIALIVIAAINPIEQANRARDARFKADGSQLISAVERYYAAHSKFPWEDCGGGTCPTSQDQFGFITAGDSTVGLCGNSSCSTGGVLITNDELKTEFLGRDWVKATTVDKQILIGKGVGTSASVYTCFVPLAKATKDKAITDKTVRTNSFTAAGVVADGSCTTASANWLTSNCFVCVPE